MKIDIHISAPGKTKELSFEAPDYEYDFWSSESLWRLKSPDFPVPFPGQCAKESPHRNKPMISIKDGVLLIEDCSCAQVALDRAAMKELYALLPGFITISDCVCSGTGVFKFGHLP